MRYLIEGNWVFTIAKVVGLRPEVRQDDLLRILPVLRLRSPRHISIHIDIVNTG